MRALPFALLAGCNWVYGLTDTRERDAPGLPPDANPFTDEDLDGVPNELDNCPGVPNPEQANVMDPDEPGDACDPDDGDLALRPDNHIIRRYYFNSSDDMLYFAPDAGFTFVPGSGYVEIDVAGTDRAFLRNLDRPMFARGTYTIEAGFELLSAPEGSAVGVFSEGDTNYTWVDHRADGSYLTILNKPTQAAVCDGSSNAGCDQEYIVTLPSRLVVQLRSGMKGSDGIKGILAGTGIDTKYNESVTPSNVGGIVAKSVRARLHFVFIYQGQ